MRFEPEIWDALNEIVKRKNLTIRELVSRIEAKRRSGGRTSAVRVFVLNYFREAATDEGHHRAGHGGLRS
jgi:predicted DNA-binding ribbon-helix-helix protein